MHCTSVTSSKFFHSFCVSKTRMLVVCDQPDLMLLFSLATAHLMVSIVMGDCDLSASVPQKLGGGMLGLW